MAGLSSAARTTNCSCSVENMHGYASKVYSKLPHCGKQNREAKLPLHRRLKQRNNCQSADRKASVGATARLFCLVSAVRECPPGHQDQAEEPFGRPHRLLSVSSVPVFPFLHVLVTVP